MVTIVSHIQVVSIIECDIYWVLKLSVSTALCTETPHKFEVCSEHLYSVVEVITNIQVVVSVVVANTHWKAKL